MAKVMGMLAELLGFVFKIVAKVVESELISSSRK